LLRRAFPGVLLGERYDREQGQYDQPDDDANPGPVEVASHLSSPAPVVKPATASPANSTSEQALMIFGGQTGRTVSMAMAAIRAAASAAMPKSPLGSSRDSKEKVIRAGRRGSAVWLHSDEATIR
jgi:hypothetical protein